MVRRDGMVMAGGVKLGYKKEEKNVPTNVKKRPSR